MICPSLTTLTLLVPMKKILTVHITAWCLYVKTLARHTSFVILSSSLKLIQFHILYPPQSKKAFFRLLKPGMAACSLCKYLEEVSCKHSSKKYQIQGHNRRGPSV